MIQWLIFSRNEYIVSIIFGIEKVYEIWGIDFSPKKHVEDYQRIKKKETKKIKKPILSWNILKVL